jgi:hypothetical protein
MIINLILINFIIVYVWDILNFPNTIAGLLTALLTKGRIKHVELKAPLGCAFCMIFWVSVIYLLICKLALLPSIAIALGCAFSSKITLYSITLIDSIIDKLFRWLDGVINK